MIAGVVVLHIWALHVVGQNNPTGIEPKSDKDTVAFTPYATIKDAFGLVVFLILFAWFVFYVPNYLGHPDNYIPANPAVTPTHIVPEWYYLPFYAILRAIPNKLVGVMALGASIVDPGLPAVARHLAGALGALSAALPAVLLGVRARSASGSAGSARKPPEGGYVIAGAHPHRSTTSIHFLIILPLLGLVETTEAAAELDLRGRAQAQERVDRGASCWRSGS